MRAPDLLLLLAAPLFWVQTRAGSHSLLNFTTTVSRPGLGEPRFIFVSYVDDTQFVRFDSVAETPRVEPCVEWMEQEEPEYWELQTQTARTQAQQSGGSLRVLIRYFNQSEDDSHTLQGMQGCDLGPDGRLLRWYNQLAYDGEDFLTLNEDLNSQTMTTSTIAQISQHKLEAHLKAGNCVELLQKHLAKGKDTLLRSEPTWYQKFIRNALNIISSIVFIIFVGILILMWCMKKNKGGTERERSTTQEASRDSRQDSLERLLWMMRRRPFGLGGLSTMRIMQATPDIVDQLI